MRAFNGYNLFWLTWYDVNLCFLSKYIRSRWSKQGQEFRRVPTAFPPCFPSHQWFATLDVLRCFRIESLLTVKRFLFVFRVSQVFRPYGIYLMTFMPIHERRIHGIVWTTPQRPIPQMGDVARSILQCKDLVFEKPTDRDNSRSGQRRTSQRLTRDYGRWWVTDPTF